jgi:repressor LexA
MTAYENGEETRENIMLAIERYILKHGYPPSFREIGKMTGIRSTSTIHHHIRILLDIGRLETDLDTTSPRALRLPGYHWVKD